MFLRVLMQLESGALAPLPIALKLWLFKIYILGEMFHQL